MTDKPISLTVDADNPFTEIFVVNGDYQLVARGVGAVAAQVVPGIFKIKTRVGRSEAEEIRLIDSDATIHLAAPSLASPIPIAGTQMTHEYQVAAAQQLSQTVHVNAGTGAEIFLMARRWSDGSLPAAPGSGPINPAAGITLLDKNGVAVIADFRTASVVEQSAGHDPWAACTVSVDPGAYVLRTAVREGGVVEQIVYAAPDWQLQLFLLDTVSRDGGEGVYLSVLGNMGLAMTKLGTGFTATDAYSGRGDLVRVALTDGRPVFSNALWALLNDMLYKKFENPILGIYGAHLMLMGQKYAARKRDAVGVELPPDSFAWVLQQDFFDEVITNLRGLVGHDHPDVEALSRKCGGKAPRATAPVTVAPMLRASWSLLVEASNEDPAVLGLELWQRIAAMVPAGPFLAWRSRAPSGVGKRAARDTGPGHIATFALTDATSFDALEDVAEAAGPSSSALQAVEAALPEEYRRGIRSDADRARMAIEMDVPRAAVDAVLGSSAT